MFVAPTPTETKAPSGAECEISVANTFTQIYIQVVFAVSGRLSLIRSEHEEEIYRYITGIVRNDGHKLIAINGMPDHIHILLGVRPDMALSDLVRDIKANSSRFINERRLVGGKFGWQEGFGAFSYSRSQLDSVIRYIRDQEQRHRRRSFKDEYLSLLRKFAVEFDDKYVFDFTERF
jgi:REP element-mobilizing transposase RayT